MNKVLRGVVRNLRKKQTKAERILWEALRNRKVDHKKFLRQHPLADNAIQKDKTRKNDLTLLGINILRFSDRDILINIEGVCENILNVIKTLK
jgi:very-short-patch-repair endonuclease